MQHLSLFLLGDQDFDGGDKDEDNVHFSHVPLDNALSQVTIGDHGQDLGSSEFTRAIRVMKAKRDE